MTKTKQTKKKPVKTSPNLSKIPTVVKGKAGKGLKDFPIEHYSYSMLAKFSTNPILFKIQYINGDRFDTSWNVSGILGKAFHSALEIYYGGFPDDPGAIENEQEAIEFGLKAGMRFIEDYPIGFINFTKTIPNKQKLQEYFTFCYNEYIKEKPWNNGEEVLLVEEKLEHYVNIKWRGEELKLPIKLKGYPDKVVKKDGKVIIKDYKTAYSFSDPDRIDARKMLQAVEYYLLVYAETGEKPYSLIYEEVKYTKNRDGSPQLKEYELVFEENALYFDLYFRFYEDITRALSGEMVYVPNIDAFFDNEVAIVAYINRLDVDEEKAAMMKKHRVDNVTDLLKKQIQNAGNMRKLMKKVEEQFVSAKSLNYNKMTNEEKIHMRLMEHGISLTFKDKIEGATVDMYRYEPTIGVKMSKILGFTADVEQVLGISGIRILAPIPKSKFIGFEVPRENRTFPELPKENDGLNIAIGQNIMGEVRRFDLRQAPHLLVAGASGSGKSIFLSSLIIQLSKVKNVEMHLYDPKIVELGLHKTDKNVVEYQSKIEDIWRSLQGLVGEMNKRYDTIAKKGARNAEEIGLPTKFVFVDEFGDLIMQKHQMYLGEEKINVSQEIADYILLLAQKARAAGIHLIVSTQRPSVDVITGTIKANFPTKAALRTAKRVDSLVILDEEGAEKLRGKGDMIFSTDEGMERLQGFNA